MKIVLESGYSFICLLTDMYARQLYVCIKGKINTIFVECVAIDT